MNTPRAMTSYFVPSPSHWPITAGIALLLTTSGAATWLNRGAAAPFIFGAGVLVLLYVLFGWFGSVIRESEAGLYNGQVDRSYRWSMAWFILSEAMFFGAFFSALFYLRFHAAPELASGDTSALWPTARPMQPWGIPSINTAILLTSAATLTWAHHGLLKGARGQLKLGLCVTIVLGFLFLGLQANEYYRAYTQLGLTLASGAYGATFFLLTGFHGLHVAIGATMLCVIFGRSLRGDFTPDDLFAFQAAAWYWHFVDVVWLLVYVLVYWL